MAYNEMFNHTDRSYSFREQIGQPSGRVYVNVTSNRRRLVARYIQDIPLPSHTVHTNNMSVDQHVLKNQVKY